MSEFKERCIESIKFVAFILVIFAILAPFFGIVLLVDRLFPALIPVMLLVVLFSIFLYCPLRFIYWLFIEPFRGKKA